MSIKEWIKYKNSKIQKDLFRLNISLEKKVSNNLVNRIKTFQKRLAKIE